MWELYTLEMQMTDKLCGAVPLSKELIGPWLESRKPSQKPDDARSIEEIEAEVLATIEQLEERTVLGFQEDETGLFMRSATIKAHLKDCSNQLRDYLGVAALRSKIANRVFVEPDRVHVMRGGSAVREIDGEFERAVHVMTAQGPRNALKRIRYVERVTLSCTLRVLAGSWKTTGGKNLSTAELLRAVLEYGAVHGYAGERGMGEGRYEFKLTGQTVV